MHLASTVNLGKVAKAIGILNNVFSMISIIEFWTLKKLLNSRTHIRPIKVNRKS